MLLVFGASAFCIVFRAFVCHLSPFIYGVLRLPQNIILTIIIRSARGKPTYNSTALSYPNAQTPKACLRGTPDGAGVKENPQPVGWGLNTTAFLECSKEFDHIGFFLLGEVRAKEQIKELDGIFQSKQSAIVQVGRRVLNAP